MSSESKQDRQLEIAHVLFIDIVGYSKLLSDEQRKLFQLLNEVVRKTSQFRTAEAAGRLVRLPTGDGMVLAFFTSVDAPVRCAQEISRKLREHPELKLRMGINSGPVDQVSDVNDQRNITGAGINMAQRVMDCGDAGHILLSKRVAGDLAQYGEWTPHLHDLGDVEVKHGVRVAISNLYGKDFGNSEKPGKLKRTEQERAFAAKSLARARRRRVVSTIAAILILGLCLGIGSWVWQRRVALTSAYKAGATGLTEKSVAVLPFDNFADKENAYFADGVQDDILTDLAKVADLKVISRRSVAQYRNSTQAIREIGQALQVAYVLEGTVRKSNGKIRVTAQLIDTRTEAERWGEKYERDVADVFTVQSEISEAIIEKLKAALSPNEKAVIEQKPTEDQEAYDLYLRARALVYEEYGVIVKVGQENFFKAVALLEAAIARDPKFTLAYCLLSEAQLSLYESEYWNKERLPKAKEAADNALRVSPNSAEAHLALAQYFYRALRDPGRAQTELAIAADSLPGDVNVFNLRAAIEEQRGQWAKALQDREKASGLDPRDQEIAGNLIALRVNLRRYNEAETLCDRMIASVSQQLTGPYWRLKSEIALARGDTKAAMAALDANPNRNAGLVGLNSLVAKVFVMERQYANATEILLSVEEVARSHNILTKEGINGYSRGHNFEMRGRIARAQGENEKARTCFEAGRPGFEDWLAKNPEQLSEYEGKARAYIAEIDAALGRKDDAIREGRHVVELWPTTRDARPATEIATILAIVYMWSGERDAALDQLLQIARLPGSPSAGDLKLNPVWDDLRKDSKFNQLIAEAAKPIRLE